MAMILGFILLWVIFGIISLISYNRKNNKKYENYENKTIKDFMNDLNIFINNKDLQISEIVHFGKITIKLYKADKKLKGQILFTIKDYMSTNEDGVYVNEDMPQAIYIDLMTALTSFNFTALAAGLGFNEDDSFKLLDIHNEDMDKINEHLNQEIGNIIVEFHMAVIENKVEKLLDNMFPDFDRDGNIKEIKIENK